MKIVSIHSSPSSKGNTATLVKKLSNELESLGAEVEFVDLAKEKLSFCKGCMSCLRTGKCVISDSLDEIRKMMIEADGLILGSPTYAIAPNAIMKNFLDRVGLFNAYSAMFGDKYIIGVSTAGGVGAKSVAKQLTNLVLCAFRHGKVVGTLHAHVGWSRVEKIPEIDQKISILSLKMFNAIESRKKYPLQKIFLKLLHKTVVRRFFYKNLIRNKDSMKAVYDYMIENKIITA